jgi:hypothetical protein
MCYVTIASLQLRFTNVATWNKVQHEGRPGCSSASITQNWRFAVHCEACGRDLLMSSSISLHCRLGSNGSGCKAKLLSVLPFDHDCGQNENARVPVRTSVQRLHRATRRPPILSGHGCKQSSKHGLQHYSTSFDPTELA